MAKTNKELLDDLFQDMLPEAQKDSQGEPNGSKLNANPEEIEEVVTDAIDAIVEPVKALEPNEVSNADSHKTDDVSVSDDDWWKVDQNEPTTPQTPNINEPLSYETLAKELGLQSQTKEDLINEYKRLREEAQKVGEYKDLPSDLAQAIKMAKNNEDYTALFKQQVGVDHKAFDDKTLLINQNAKYFTDPAGQVDKEALYEYVEDMTPIQQKIEASKIREQIEDYNQRVRENALRAEYEKKQLIQNELTKAISETNNVKGFTVTPEHKTEALNKISTGEAVKEMFYKSDGKSYDMNKLFEVYFIYKNFDKIKTFLTRRATDAVKKEEFNKISNANINAPQHSTNVAKGAQKSDYLSDYIEMLNRRNAGTNVQQ